MRDELRWAARYQFLDSLWRGRDRLILDPALERSLGTGGGVFDPRAAGPAVELAESLVPTEPPRETVSVVVSRGRRAADYARRRGGCTFVGLDEATSLADEERWSVALVDLQGLVDDRRTLRSDDAETLPVEVSTFLEALAERREGDQDVVITAPAGDGGVEADDFVDLVLQFFPGARVYGVAWPGMAAVYDFGDVEGDDGDEAEEVEDQDAEATQIDAEGANPDEITTTLVDEGLDDGASYDAELDAAEAAWADDAVTEVFAGTDAGDEDAGPAEIEVDTSLGAEEPEIDEWVAVVSDKALTDALTYVELWSSTAAAVEDVSVVRDRPTADDAGVSGLRAELEEARRQADLLAIERQRLMEQLDDAESALSAHAEALEAADGEPEPPDAADRGERLEASLAREQSLRWEVARLEQEVEELRARPVESLEAEVARLQAQLEVARLQAPEPGDAGEPEETVEAGASAGPGLPASEQTMARRTALGQVEKLTRRVERGGLSSLELHRALRRIRDVLGRPR